MTKVESRAQLLQLEQAVQRASLERTMFMQTNAALLCDFNVGERIYASVASDGYKMRPAGIVTRAYAYERHGRWHIGCEFERRADYPFVNNTEGDFSMFYNESAWKREIESRKKKLDEELHS